MGATVSVTTAIDNWQFNVYTPREEDCVPDADDDKLFHLVNNNKLPLIVGALCTTLYNSYNSLGTIIPKKI